MEKRTHYFNAPEGGHLDEDLTKMDLIRSERGKKRIALRKLADDLFEDGLNNLERRGLIEKEFKPWCVENANRYLGQLLSQYGLVPKPISADNISFDMASDSKFLHDGNALGLISPNFDEITVYLDPKRLIETIKVTAHELLHYNSFQTFKIEDNEQTVLFHNQRIGLAVRNRLDFLNEGLTEFFANKDMYEFVSKDKQLREIAEEQLKMSKISTLNEYNIEILTNPAYDREVQFIRELIYMLKEAYEVDEEEVQHWLADAYFKGNLLQLFKKIKKVTSQDFIDRMKRVPRKIERGDEEWNELVALLRQYSDMYDRGIDKTIPDDRV